MTLQQFLPTSEKVDQCHAHGVAVAPRRAVEHRPAEDPDQ